MDVLHIPIDHWEREALEELAHVRGLDSITLARRLLGERIRAVRLSLLDRWPAPRDRVVGQPSCDTLEARLSDLFDV